MGLGSGQQDIAGTVGQGPEEGSLGGLPQRAHAFCPHPSSSSGMEFG